MLPNTQDTTGDHLYCKYVRKSLLSTLFFYVLICSVILVFTGITIFFDKDDPYPAPVKMFYAADYSHVLTKETEDFIIDQSDRLNRLSKAQIVVATVPDTADTSLEDYSLNMARGWGIGDKELNNGVLILFTTDEPHARIEVGYGLEGCITDGIAGEILDKYAVESKDQRLWNKAAINTYIAVSNLVYKEYDLKIPDELLQFKDTVDEDTKGIITENDGDFSNKVEPLDTPFSEKFEVFAGVSIIMLIMTICMAVVHFAVSLLHVLMFGDIRKAASESTSGIFSGGGFGGGGGGFGGGGASR